MQLARPNRQTKSLNKLGWSLNKPVSKDVRPTRRKISIATRRSCAFAFCTDAGLLATTRGTRLEVPAAPPGSTRRARFSIRRCRTRRGSPLPRSLRTLRSRRRGCFERVTSRRGTASLRRMDPGRRQRAEARRVRAVLHRKHLASQETDLSPLRGAEAIALAVRLTRESYSMSGQTDPQYTREQIPYRFVPWPSA